MEIPAELVRLSRLLRGVISSRGLKLQAISESFEKHPRYLGRALGDPELLRVRDVFGVLGIARVSVRLFFSYHYRLGATAGSGQNERSGFIPPTVDPLARLLLEREESDPASVPDAEAYTRRVLNLLAFHIDLAGLTQKDAARRAGLTSAQLHHLLKGHTALTVKRLLRLLEVLELSAARFFAEVTAPDPEELLVRPDLAETLSLLDRLGAEMRTPEALAVTKTHREQLKRLTGKS